MGLIRIGNMGLLGVLHRHVNPVVTFTINNYYDKSITTFILFIISICVKMFVGDYDIFCIQLL